MSKFQSINLKSTPERVELVREMASNDRQKAYAAQEAFAAYIRPAVETVINQKSTAGMIYTDQPFSKNDRPTIPLDLFVGTQEKHISIWAQQVAGGLATNLIQGLGEYTFQVYRLDSAISFYNEHLKNANLSVLSMGLERMANEFIVRQERNAWIPILQSLADASTNSIAHVQSAAVAGTFQLDDLNTLFTKIDRIWASYAGGTPDASVGTGLTDLFVSPEIIGQIRKFTYNPMNTRGGYKSDGTESSNNSIPLPDEMRMEFYKRNGAMSLYDVELHKLLELGKGAKYNTLFDSFYSGSFNPATQEILVGADLSRNVFLRPVITDDDNGGGQLVLRPDDQFVARNEKVGFYGKMSEGRLVLDNRALVGLIV